MKTDFVETLTELVRASSKTSFLAVFIALFGISSAMTAVKASTANEGELLFQQTLKHPGDVALAMSFAKLCIEKEDYEAAIGTLERVLFNSPDDANLKADIGFLYYRLKSPQMGKHYFDEALASSSLDEGRRTKILAIGAEVTSGVTGNRFFGSLQTGLQFQSNASFNPDNLSFRLAGQDYLLSNPQNSGGDGNLFGIAQIGYDHDLGDANGTMLETRFTGYVTRQFHFTKLDIGLFDASIGPRLKLALDSHPDWTIKPYLAGGQVWLGGTRYFTSAGIGLVADMPFSSGFALQPGVEFRYANFSAVSVFSKLNTGDTATVSVASRIPITPDITALSRLSFTRGYADTDFQSYVAVAEELSVLFRFGAPIPSLGTTWSLSPYVKLLQTKADGANPYIDPGTIQRDSEWQVGLLADMPITNDLSITTNVQYAEVASTIPNYREHNFSVLSGPSFRF